MQTVFWHPTLSALVQHDDFVHLAEEIRLSGDRCAVFHPASETTSSLYEKRSTHLLERAAIQNSTSYNKQFCENPECVCNDQSYKARDQTESGAKSAERASKTFKIASTVQEWPSRLKVSKDLLRQLRDLKSIHHLNESFDTSSALSELLEISFSDSWGPLHTLCRSCTSPNTDKYRLLFAFSTIAYGKELQSLNPLRDLLAFSFIPELRQTMDPPSCSFVPFRDGADFSQEQIHAVLMKHTKQRNTAPETNLSKAERKAERKRQESAFNKMKQDQATLVEGHYQRQWPSATPHPPEATMFNLLNIPATHKDVSLAFSTWTNVGLFERYLEKVQLILNMVYENAAKPDYVPEVWQLRGTFSGVQGQQSAPTLPDLFLRDAPPLPPMSHTLTIDRIYKASRDNEKLRQLVQSLNPESDQPEKLPIRAQYSKDLQSSLNALRKYEEPTIPEAIPYSQKEVIDHLKAWNEDVGTSMVLIEGALRAKDLPSEIFALAGLWPRLTLGSLLAALSSKSSYGLPPGWRQCLLAFGESVTLLQRAKRLTLAYEHDDITSFCLEADNVGRIGWDLVLWPDWLLIEIENDLLIRRNQAEVALEMIQPSKLTNSLVQLNMVSLRKHR